MTPFALFLLTVSSPQEDPAAVLPAPGAEKQWPGLRGPTGQGLVPDARIPTRWGKTDGILWKTRLPGRGYSSPAIWGDRLWVTAEGPAPESESGGGKGPARLLLCYDRRNGRLLWQHAADRPADAEALHTANSFATSTPVTDGERVIVFFGNSGLVCCDLEGRRVWSRDLGGFWDRHGPAASAVLYGDLVLAIEGRKEGDSWFVAFDKRTGEPRWRTRRGSDECYSTPVVLRVNGRDEIVVNGGRRVAGYDPKTGRPLWTAKGSGNGVNMVVAGGGLIFSAASTGGSFAPTLAIRAGGEGDVSETHVAWKLERGAPIVPSPSYHEGRLFLVGDDSGVLTCLDAATGKQIYRERLGGRFSASPLLLGDRLLFMNMQGKAFLIQAGPTFRKVAEYDIGEPTYATPAVLDGRIYLRTREHLICIGESTPPEK